MCANDEAMTGAAVGLNTFSASLKAEKKPKVWVINQPWKRACDNLESSGSSFRG